MVAETYYLVPAEVPRCQVCQVPLSPTYFHLAGGYPYLPGEQVFATDRPEVLMVWRHFVTSLDDIEALAATPHYVKMIRV